MVCCWSGCLRIFLFCFCICLFLLVFFSSRCLRRSVWLREVATNKKIKAGGSVSCLFFGEPLNRWTKATTLNYCTVSRAQSATASVHTSHMSKAVMYPVFKVLRNGLLFGTYFTHVQSCNETRVQSAAERTASVHTSHMALRSCNVTRVQSATECTALVHISHMSKAVM